MSSSRPVYAFNSVIVREPPRSVVNGLRAHDAGSPTYEGVKAEHDAYVSAMSAAGVEVTVLPPLEAYPDSIFVEDPALVFAEGAILLRPGTASRMGETAEIAPTLRDLFEVVLDLPQPGFADGGDVLTTRNSVMIGLSARTDKAGAEALVTVLGKLGRKGEIVATPEGVLHFKTDCSLLDAGTILSTERLSASGCFDGYKLIHTAPGEEAAANTIRFNDVVLMPAGFPGTKQRIEQAGFTVVEIGNSECAKLDGGMSCLSLRFTPS